MEKRILLMATAILAASCTGGNKTNEETAAYDVSIDSCEYSMGNVTLTKLIHGDMGEISQRGDTIVFAAKQGTDYFSDPEGEQSNFNAPMLMMEVDNTRPFTLTVRVKPDFPEVGVYSAGTIIAYADQQHWQKICFEQDEQCRHRLVTMRTVGLSDDVDHEVCTAEGVWLRFSTNSKIVGNYYSVDGEHWQLLRDYPNDYPQRLLLGIMTQCPQDSLHTCTYTDMHFVERAVKDFRTGEL